MIECTVLVHSRNGEVINVQIRVGFKTNEEILQQLNSWSAVVGDVADIWPLEIYRSTSVKPSDGSTTDRRQYTVLGWI